MNDNDRLLRLPEVKHRTGLSRTTIYRRIGGGTFPRSIQIGPNTAAWYESSINEWLADPAGWQAAA